MFNNVILFIILFITWVVLSGYFGSFFLISGAVSCLIALYYAKKMDVIDNNSYPIYLSPKIMTYFFWLAKEILKSSIDVSVRVWQPKPKISPMLAWVKSSQKNDVGKVAYANSITLTPGTVCIEVCGDELCVHALNESGVEDLKSGYMDNKVTKVTG